MKRKEFVSKVCPALLISMMSFPVLNSCSKLDEPEEENNRNPILDQIGVDGYLYQSSKLYINLSNANFSSLKNTSSFVNHSPQGVLILRKSPTEILAFDHCCPHQGTRNQWTFTGTVFRCGNHGNTYGIAEGNIAHCNSNTIMGNLKQYPATMDGDLITVDFS